jgi:hypothetical protein
MLREATYPRAAVNVLDVSSESMAAFQVFMHGRFWVFAEALPIGCEAVTLTRRTVGKLFLKGLTKALHVIRFYTVGTIGSTICEGCRSSW